jgi:phosphoglycerate dehydrogenase-like enzyme
VRSAFQLKNLISSRAFFSSLSGNSKQSQFSHATKDYLTYQQAICRRNVKGVVNKVAGEIERMASSKFERMNDSFVVGIIGMGDMGKMYARRLSDAGWR